MERSRSPRPSPFCRGGAKRSSIGMKLSMVEFREGTQKLFRRARRSWTSSRTRMKSVPTMDGLAPLAQVFCKKKHFRRIMRNTCANFCSAFACFYRYSPLSRFLFAQMLQRGASPSIVGTLLVRVLLLAPTFCARQICQTFPLLKSSAILNFMPMGGAKRSPRPNRLHSAGMGLCLPGENLSGSVYQRSNSSASCCTLASLGHFACILVYPSCASL
jgi:hypothetical protein